MINFFLNKHLLNNNDVITCANFGGQDVFLLIPFLSEELYYNVFLPHLGTHNESLYTKWFYSGKKHINHTEIKNCDYSILPFKYNKLDERVNQTCHEARVHNKKVIAFFTDDSDEIYNLPDNLLLFRTSLNCSNNKKDYVMPALHPDHFSGFNEYKNKIGFCGQLTRLRQFIINKIKQTNIETDFIFRQGFWAPEVGSKIKARKQYYENLLDNRYALCIRGAGNFSFRFYEALCFGRIPILIDTDTALPFERIIDWEKHIIKIKENELADLPNIIKNDTRCMEGNRKLWETYFSVEGYAKNFIKELVP